jgi:hypothetical protein
MSKTRSWILLAAPLCAASLLAATSTVPPEPGAPVAQPAPLASPATPARAATPATVVEPAAVEPAAAPARYIGAGKCKNCHSAEKTGAQYAQWEKMLHSKAFETLAGDKAKELAKAKGIDDPQKSDACLKCHTTANGEAADNIAKGFKPEMGVQCESCHGPGEAHLKARMAAAAETDPAKATPVSATEIIAEPKLDTCVKCHNPESPSFKPFCFKLAFAKIAHLNPAKQRSEAETKALKDGCACGSDCKCQHGADDPRCAASEASPGK